MYKWRQAKLNFFNHCITICAVGSGLKGATLMEWLKHFVIDHDGTCVLVNDLKQGTRYYKNTDGEIAYEYNYVNDRQHGVERGYYANCQIRHESNCANDNLHGVHRYWYETGQLKHESYYINDERHGVHRHWDVYGRLIFANNYINGTIQN
jgi:antitoxin component YwqK of YwqJK toxin-antitoxin module